MKILVLGGSGFIGRNLVEDLLSTGHDIYMPSHVAVDCRSASDLDHAIEGMDMVVQCAALTSGSKDILERPQIHTTDNAVMNSLILRTAFAHRVKHFIFISSSFMYPSRDKPWREDEWHPGLLDQINPAYFGAAWTKVYIEKMCEFYSRLGITKHTVIRPSNCYGPYDKGHHVVGALLKKAQTEDKLEVWGDGSEARDVMHVADLVRLIRLVIEKPHPKPFEIYNAGYERAFPIADIARVIGKRYGREVVYDRSKPTIKTSMCLDFMKAYETFGWSPKLHPLQAIAECAP